MKHIFLNLRNLVDFMIKRFWKLVLGQEQILLIGVEVELKHMGLILLRKLLIM